jgi:hypothetical protein
MIAHQRWATQRVEDEIPLPVRYEPMAIERERFYPVPPNLLAEIAAERLTRGEASALAGVRRRAAAA